jgi:hypothetical protein
MGARRRREEFAHYASVWLTAEQAYDACARGPWASPARIVYVMRISLGRLHDGATRGCWGANAWV